MVRVYLLRALSLNIITKSSQTCLQVDRTFSIKIPLMPLNLPKEVYLSAIDEFNKSISSCVPPPIYCNGFVDFSNQCYVLKIFFKDEKNLK